jgi:Lar family restriction alleviation protein
MSELKCCPFCGGEANYISFTQGLFIQRFVTCTKCGIETPRNCLNKKDAIKRWNNRTPMANIVEKLEEKNIDISGNTSLHYLYSEGYIDALDYVSDIVKQEIDNERRRYGRFNK